MNIQNVVKWGFACVIATVTINVFLVWVMHLGVIYNISNSMKPGFYVMLPLGEIQKDDIVASCVGESSIHSIVAKYHILTHGVCGGNGLSIFKRVYADKGDVVSINDYNVTINGKIVPNSKAFDAEFIYNLDDYKLVAGEYLLLSLREATSIDSRYFGVVNQSQIIAKVETPWQVIKSLFLIR